MSKILRRGRRWLGPRWKLYWYALCLQAKKEAKETFTRVCEQDTAFFKQCWCHFVRIVLGLQAMVMPCYRFGAPSHLVGFHKVLQHCLPARFYLRQHIHQNRTTLFSRHVLFLTWVCKAEGSDLKSKTTVQRVVFTWSFGRWMQARTAL